jgi:formate hydrogenlyase subunit 6/NADH:ubiquinone oxidoreductase subunit I
MNKNQKNNSKFDKWHGIDRKKIDWYPVIDRSKCIGCGMCVTSCSRDVYKYDYENKKSKVVNPTNCMVACQTCANLCPVGAISFVKAGETTREKAQKIVKDFQVLPKVKKELEERKKELKYN